MYKRRAYKHKCLKKIYGRYIWKIDQILKEWVKVCSIIEGSKNKFEKLVEI